MVICVWTDVIPDQNNTGKSSIGKKVFALFNSLVDIEDKILKQKWTRIRQVLNLRIAMLEGRVYTKAWVGALSQTI